jgi:hypothetical protein
MSNGFVFVPNVLGVPPVNFAPASLLAAAVGTITQLFADTTSQFSSVFSPQWGIFDVDTGFPVVTAESVVGFEFRNDWTVSDYPVEGGVFQSYDKVTLPFVAKVRFSAGSTAALRQNLLNSIASAAAVVPGAQPVYSVITPEFTYLQAVITHYDYQRTSQQGVGLLVVDVWLTQVVPTAESPMTASTVQNPSSATSLQGGQVSPETTDISGGAGFG